MINTGDKVLDDASREFSHTEDIDVFNNMLMWARHTALWRACGRPRAINWTGAVTARFEQKENKYDKQR